MVAEILRVLRPDVEESAAPLVTLAARDGSDGARRLLLIDNSKPNAGALLRYTAEELATRIELRTVEMHRKESAGRPLEAAQAAELADQADLVITGLGDCGACSACSLHDALAFEALGVPATVLITDVFIDNVLRFSENLGRPGYHMLVVPHPVASKSDGFLQELARSVADAAREQLVGGPRI